MLKKLAPVVAIASIAALSACGGEATPPPEPSTTTTPEASTAPPAPEGYQVAAVTNGGTISGTVKVTGNIPAPEKIEVNKDESVCGKEKTGQDIQIASDGSLANAVVWIDDIKQGKDWSDAKAGAVDQKGCAYTPEVQILAPGASFDVINSDPILHNIHAYAGDETLFNIAQPIQGMKTTKTIDKTGPIHLKCDVHSWMSAWVFVTTNPYYALTGSDGSFSLGDVPPGTYTVKVWHGKLGEKSTSVTVEAGGTATANFELQSS